MPIVSEISRCQDPLVSPPSNTDSSLDKAAPSSGDRDLRFDLFRGLANWAIFLNHIPDNLVNWVTTRNYGFSDAADIFVFISGYMAAFVYAEAMRRQRTLSVSARILKRAWQIYLAHVFLFVIYLAEIGYLAEKSNNPLFVEEFNVFEFLRDPDIVLIQGLILKFKPVNMDVLPLFVVLMLMFPLILWCLLHWPNLTLLGSALLYVLARLLGWNLPAFPTGQWFFNPFAWQFLFVFAAWCGVGALQQIAALLHSQAVLALAICYLLFGLIMTLGWRLPWLHALIPSLIDRAVNPIDKTNLDPLRFLHFVALTLIIARLVHRNWAGLQRPMLRPAILCGQHSLEVFCFGIFLAFAGHFVLVEISSRAWMQVVVSFAGIALMTALAYLLTWYQRLDERMAEVARRSARGHAETNAALVTEPPLGNKITSCPSPISSSVCQNTTPSEPP
jgi:hypothetical protein